MKKGIAVAGTLIADTFYGIDTYPREGMLVSVRDVNHYVGGTGNIIMDLAKIDPEMPVKVSAIIGTDERGKLIKDTLGRFPNVSMANVTEEGESSYTLVMNAKDTKQRTFFTGSAAGDTFCEDYIDWEKIDADIFQLEYLLLMKTVDGPDEEYITHGARILHDAKEHGMKTSIDVVSEEGERGRKVVAAALPYVDYCCLNEMETMTATGLPLVKDGAIDEAVVLDALKAMADMGVSTWVVIHSPKMNYGYDCESGEMVKVESLHLPDGYIVGTNGAGDAYCAGILYGAYVGYNLQRSMEFAAASAACSLSQYNGTDGMREAEEVWKLHEKMR